MKTLTILIISTKGPGCTLLKSSIHSNILIYNFRPTNSSEEPYFLYPDLSEKMLDSFYPLDLTDSKLKEKSLLR